MSRCVSFRRFRDPALRFPPLAPAGDSSPASQVLSECSDFPSSVPPRSLEFARRYHALLLVVRQRGVAVTGSSSELRRCLNPLPSTPTRRDGGISRVPRQPLCEHALLVDPGGPDTPRRLTTHPMLPSVQLTTSAPRSVTFRGSNTQPVRSLSTLRSSDYSDHTTQDSLPAGGQPWRGRTRTCWAAFEGFSRQCHFTSLRSSSAKLRLAHRTP